MFVACAGVAGSAEEMAKALKGVPALVVTLEAEGGSVGTVTTTTIPVPHWDAVTDPGWEEAERKALAGGSLEYAEQTDAGRGAMGVLLKDQLATGGAMTAKGFEDAGNDLVKENGRERITLLRKLVKLWEELGRSVDRERDAACAKLIDDRRAESERLLEIRLKPPRVRVVGSEEATATGLRNRPFIERFGGVKLDVLKLIAGPQIDQAQIGEMYAAAMQTIDAAQSDPEKCLAELKEAVATSGDLLGGLLVGCGGTCVASGGSVVSGSGESGSVDAARLPLLLVKATHLEVLEGLLVREAVSGELPESLLVSTYWAVVEEMKQESLNGEVVSILENICLRCRKDKRGELPEAVRAALRSLRTGGEGFAA